MPTGLSVGGRLAAGFVLGTPMDSVFAYGMPPIEMRERFEEARQLILRAWSEPRAVRLQRQVQPAALRQYLAAPDAEANRRSGCRAEAAAWRPGTWSTSTTTATAICRSPGCTRRSRWSTGSGSTSSKHGGNTESASDGVHADRLPGQHRRRGGEEILRGGALLPSQLGARRILATRPATRPIESMQGFMPATWRWAEQADARGSDSRQPRRDELLGVRREGLHHRGHAGSACASGCAN